MGCRCGCQEPHECLCITPEEAKEMSAEEIAGYGHQYTGLLEGHDG